jgi:hypothetical protein
LDYGALRTIGDPEAERARIEQRFARVMGQPRKTLLRKAAVMIAGLTTVLVALGLLLIVATDEASNHVFGRAGRVRSRARSAGYLATATPPDLTKMLLT